MIASSAEAAEIAATYVIERVIEHGGPRYFQGMRNPPLPCRAASTSVARFARERFRRVPTLAAEALVAWAEGATPVELLTHVPDASYVLGLQSVGARCVSLLPEATETKPHENRFEFVLHDLCHLGNFVCSPYYAEQVGFFAMLKSAFGSSAWRRLELELDADFRRDRDHVATDMNGSSVFLFAVLKMKLKMAARRAFARSHGAVPPARGPLSPAELDAFRNLFDVALDAFGLEGRVRAAAQATSARRDAPEMAKTLADYFGGEGRVILSARAA